MIIKKTKQQFKDIISFIKKNYKVKSYLKELQIYFYLILLYIFTSITYFALTYERDIKYTFLRILFAIGDVLILFSVVIRASKRQIQLIENQKKMEESENKFKVLFYAAADAIFLTEVNGFSSRFIEVNDIACKRLGYTRKELLSMLPIEISPAAFSEVFFNASKEMRKSKTTRFETTQVTKDGRQVSVEVSSHAIEINGEPRVISISRDITHRKKMERELKEKEEMLRAILDATVDGIVLVNHDGKVLHYNSIFKKMWKLSDEILEFMDMEILLKEIVNQLYDSRKTYKKCKEAFYNNEETTFLIEFKDGTILEVISKLLVQKEISIGKIWSCRDVTKQKEMERKLREREENYRKLVELSPDAICVHLEGILLFANPAAGDLVRIRNGHEYIGKDIFRFVHPEDREKTMEYMRKIYEEKTQVEAEFRLIREDGFVIHAEMRSTSFPYQGEETALVIVRDITERKQEEYLKEKMQEKERLLREAKHYDELKNDFFANISHELRTPVNIIFSTIQLLQLYIKEEESNSKKINKYLYITKQNCYRLLRLINNLIDITKIDTSFYEIKLENHNIINIVEDVTLSVAEYIENNDIKLIFDTQVEEKIIACDPSKIERILLNLFSNAVKFSEKGGKIFVNVHDLKDKIRISIKDTGIGIPEDKIDIIFERFRQVDKSIRRNHEGSGIGLSLVKALVEMHDGRIYVKSIYGEGTEFIIELPVKTIYEEENKEYLTSPITQDYVERISIEFSDIYS